MWVTFHVPSRFELSLLTIPSSVRTCALAPGHSCVARKGRAVVAFGPRLSFREKHTDPLHNVGHRDTGGGDFFYVACSIRPLVPFNTTRLQRLHDSVRERQVLRFSTIVTREEHTVTILGATGGSFLFYGADTLSRVVDWDSSTSHSCFCRHSFAMGTASLVA